MNERTAITKANGIKLSMNARKANTMDAIQYFLCTICDTYPSATHRLHQDTFNVVEHSEKPILIHDSLMPIFTNFPY